MFISLKQKTKQPHTDTKFMYGFSVKFNQSILSKEIDTPILHMISQLE